MYHLTHVWKIGHGSPNWSPSGLRPSVSCLTTWRSKKLSRRMVYRRQVACLPIREDGYTEVPTGYRWITVRWLRWSWTLKFCTSVTGLLALWHPLITIVLQWLKRTSYMETRLPREHFPQTNETMSIRLNSKYQYVESQWFPWENDDLRVCRMHILNVGWVNGCHRPDLDSGLDRWLNMLNCVP